MFDFSIYIFTFAFVFNFTMIYLENLIFSKFNYIKLIEITNLVLMLLVIYYYYYNNLNLFVIIINILFNSLNNYMGLAICISSGLANGIYLVSNNYTGLSFINKVLLVILIIFTVIIIYNIMTNIL